MRKIYAVDFDGTIVFDAYPEIGSPNWSVINYIKSIQDNSIIILWSCRCGGQLQAAVEYCKSLGIRLDYVNENVPEHVEKYGGSDCRKVFADVYIDDKAINAHSLFCEFYCIGEARI